MGTTNSRWRRWTATTLRWLAPICHAGGAATDAVERWQPWSPLLHSVGMLAAAGATAIVPPPTRDGRSGCADDHD